MEKESKYKKEEMMKENSNWGGGVFVGIGILFQFFSQKNLAKNPRNCNIPN